MAAVPRNRNATRRKASGLCRRIVVISRHARTRSRRSPSDRRELGAFEVGHSPYALPARRGGSERGDGVGKGVGGSGLAVVLACGLPARTDFAGQSGSAVSTRPLVSGSSNAAMTRRPWTIRAKTAQWQSHSVLTPAIASPDQASPDRRKATRFRTSRSAAR